LFLGPGAAGDQKSRLAVVSEATTKVSYRRSVRPV
jgi:hypothetical protein